MGIVGDLHRDAKLLMASRGIRAFAFSYLNVVFAIYLDRLGYTPVTIGVVYLRRLFERRGADRALGLSVGPLRPAETF